MPTNILYKTADGATAVTGSTKDLGQIVASPSQEVDTTPIKMALENLSDRALGASPFSSLVFQRQQIGTGDGFTFGYTATDPNGTLSRPWGPGLNSAGVLNGAPTAADGGAGGAWGAAGVYGWVVAATNATGETVGSVEVTFNVTDTTRKVLITWAQTPGAAGYKVFRTATPGTYPASSLTTTIVGGATATYLDAGAAPGVGAPRADNTTGGAGPTYGTAPAVSAHDATDKTIATAAGGGLAVGQQWFFWLVAKIPAGATSIGNKRSLRLIPKEV